MNLYDKYILPPLLEHFMSRDFFTEKRIEILRTIEEGDILEIGIGTGLNIPHYPEEVHRIVTVDVIPTLNSRVQERARKSSINVDLKIIKDENLPFDNDSFDTVLSTWTLCSIPDPRITLDEIHRVLKPGGKFLCIEHGANPKNSIRKWQNRFSYLSRTCCGGCNLNRDIRNILESSKFSKIKIEEFDLDGIGILGRHHYQGTLTKST